jgi:hypothetical protein
MNTNELKQLIASKLDVVEFLDIIGYTIDDLVERLEDEIIQYAEELTRACD